MGSVCGSTLALMDAGVSIKAPVGGIAMGLVKEGDDYVILPDIQGAEDHLGDMDFKVAGSRDGITALQMDIKITGVTQEIMRNALEQAKQAREFILDKMAETIPASRTELPSHAPPISTVKIDPEKIGLVIGTGREPPGRRARRARSGGGQGPWPDRPQADRQARERLPCPARGADRARQERASARA